MARNFQLQPKRKLFQIKTSKEPAFRRSGGCCENQKRLFKDEKRVAAFMGRINVKMPDGVQRSFFNFSLSLLKSPDASRRVPFFFSLSLSLQISLKFPLRYYLICGQIKQQNRPRRLSK